MDSGAESCGNLRRGMRRVVIPSTRAGGSGRRKGCRGWYFFDRAETIQDGPSGIHTSTVEVPRTVVALTGPALPQTDGAPPDDSVAISPSIDLRRSSPVSLASSILLPCDSLDGLDDLIRVLPAALESFKVERFDFVKLATRPAVLELELCVVQNRREPLRSSTKRCISQARWGRHKMQFLTSSATGPSSASPRDRCIGRESYDCFVRVCERNRGCN